MLCRTIIVKASTPGRKIAALEFQKEIRLGKRSSSRTTGSSSNNFEPGLGVCARKSARITVKPINIYRASNILIICAPRYTSLALLVVCEWNCYARCPKCCLDLFHICDEGASY